MAEITRERVGQLQRGILTILRQHPDGLPAKDVLAELQNVVPPTPFEESDYPNHPGVRRFERIARFVSIALVKAGWLVKDRGQWYLTDGGRGAFETHTDPATFAREASRLYTLWKKEQPEDEAEGEDEEVAVSAAATLEEAEEAAWSEMENYLADLNPYDFQDLVAGLLKGMGYHISYVSPPGADKGIDIVAHADPLGIKTPTIKVQVKRRQDKANVDSIRAFLAVLGGTDVGLFICTGGFTKDAEEEARGQQLRRIMLINLKRLYALWIEHYARVPEEHRHLLPLKPVYYLALPD